VGVKVIVKRNENIESIINRFRRVCLNANLAEEMKKRQFYVKESSLRHIKDREQVRRRKHQKRKEELINKFGIDSVPMSKKRRSFI